MRGRKRKRPVFAPFSAAEFDLTGFDGDIISTSFSIPLHWDDFVVNSACESTFSDGKELETPSTSMAESVVSTDSQTGFVDCGF